MYIYPYFKDIRIDSCSYPLMLCCGSFQNIRTLYTSKKQILAKLAPDLTMKSCYPSVLERST